ncbi:PTPA-CTERM sorting domain-containing protein [Nodosilinea sp. LEGE 07088]|uniref:PTPA-CTERM sorting domain-containing protein n=1 Tax=Nodosilinea sp. LEGE 07088 TaxID=2777968 RepID=UPI00187E4E21|nr:PTPA-CTERM sorting domain-containing protein [Nodosilinea sp. LEGE 07088]MBE9138307.1 PTPA-CTERM sorting domain-containing protein [Nodosilinea sp. LEGE 07088]
MTNLLDKGNLGTDIFQGPEDVVVVTPGLELVQFGGIWDIDLDDNAISFSLNSIFGNVESGNDIYRFEAPNLYQPGQLPTINIFSFAAFSPDNSPFARFTGSNKLEVVFPLGFAPEGLIPPQPDTPLAITTTLPVQPFVVPTPALLPGLIGMGLTIWRKQRRDDDAS